MIDIEQFYLGLNNYTLEKNNRLKNIFSTIFQIPLETNKKKVTFSDNNIVHYIDYNSKDLFYAGYEYLMFRSECFSEIQLKMITDHVNRKEAMKLLYQ
tara:strand:- start:23 stop:316 length:294 start_codon:yes stop_codon:yes gene_type:complete